MKLLVELSADGLAVYLHNGHSPTRLRPGHAEETLITMLRHANQLEQSAKRITIGDVAAPTEQQLHHWQYHQKTKVKGCPFCKPAPGITIDGLEEYLPKPVKGKKR